MNSRLHLYFQKGRYVKPKKKKEKFFIIKNTIVLYKYSMKLSFSCIYLGWEKKKIQQKYDFYCTHDIIITQNNHSSIVIKCREKRQIVNTEHT